MMKPCLRCGLEILQGESSMRYVRVRDNDYDIEHTTAETCVERLRQQVQTLDSVLSARFKRSVRVEQRMFDVANGKEGLPSRETLRAWALELGTPDK